MKVLILGPRVDDRAAIRDFGGVWSYYLSRELRALGVELVYDKGPATAARYATLDLNGVRHAIGLGHWADRATADAAWVLAERLPGGVCQIRDRSRVGDPVMLTFTICDDRRDPHGSRHIGWAADETLISPRQQSEKLCILIDHPNYGPGARVDLSREILDDVAAFVAGRTWRGRWSAIRVRRLVDGGVEYVDLKKPHVPPFTRQHVPFETICEEYCATHVFLVTHPESLGLTVLETAYAGALPVVPEGFIAPQLLSTVRHVTYSGSIPWDQVLAEIDVAASRKKALRNSWPRVAARVLSYLEECS